MEWTSRSRRRTTVPGEAIGARGKRPWTPGHAGSVILGLLLALSLATSACRSATCCPAGPPYRPACSESFYYYFHGNQLATVSVGEMLDTSPWRHTGRVRRGSGAATGVLIHPSFVLTAAHVVMKNGDQFPTDDELVFFSLTQPCPGCLPYGTKSASRIWVPEEWIDNVGGDRDSAETRAYDWALLEVHLDPNSFNDGVPDPEPMPVANVTFAAFESLTPRALGYACGSDAGGAPRRRARPYATDGSGSFLGQDLFPEVGGAGGGGLIRTSLEGVAGMSGGPVWVEIGGEPQLVGVLIGSPQEACNQGENWVAALSPNTRQRILGVIQNGSAPGMVAHGFQAGGGGFDVCEGLGTFTGACPAAAFETEGEATCGNPEG